jgi:hypothetical protein
MFKFGWIKSIYDYIFFVKPSNLKPKKPTKKQIENYKKKPIPKALREQVWVHYMGKVYKGKCHINWCGNEIDVFNYHVGHNIPECDHVRLCIWDVVSTANVSKNDVYVTLAGEALIVRCLRIRKVQVLSSLRGLY